MEINILQPYNVRYVFYFAIYLLQSRIEHMSSSYFAYVYNSKKRILAKILSCLP
jgi:hypothetical protein